MKKIAVFRGLYLGDLVAATGALRALRRGHPRSEITLISLPWATALGPHLSPYVDRVLPYPGAPGLDGGGNRVDLEEFLVRMRDERFDLAVNMHGKGPTSTRLVARFEADKVASFVGEKGSSVPALDVAVPWGSEAHESRKLLLLAENVGGVSAGPEPELRVRAEDEGRARTLLPVNSLKPLALVHPGASVAQKRWKEEGFKRVAESLTHLGYTVAVTGSAREKELTRRVATNSSLDFGGLTCLSTLIALVAQASLFISNDTGPAHLAYALKIPSVTIFGPSTLNERWGPLNRKRHAVLHGDPISGVSSKDVLRSVEELTMGRERSA